ncbi:MAG: hypothetical protein FVQ80_11385 [Planctomycetes bacterium]|nr:hypothetical protein [Planctomycetota bacterium]
MLHEREDYNDRIQDNDNLIRSDEPVFLLRAIDKNAPGVLEEYSNRVARVAGHDTVLVAQVRAHAQAMRKWQKKNDILVKEPYMNPEDAVYYIDEEESESEEEEKEDEVEE